MKTGSGYELVEDAFENFNDFRVKLTIEFLDPLRDC